MTSSYTTVNWDNITFSLSYTAFGIYDKDLKFLEDSTGFAKFIVRSLGYPNVNVLLAPLHIYTSLLSAIMKYSAIVNLAKISDNMLNVFGGDTSVDLTNAAIYLNLVSTFEISNMYGQLSIIRNSLHTLIYSTSLMTVPGQQIYNLLNYIPLYTNSNVQLLLIYYYPRLYSYTMDAMINPGFNMSSIMDLFGGVMSQNARLTVMPIFLTALKMQSLLLSQQIRRAHVGFLLRKNKILFYPTPKSLFLVQIDYILKSDKRNNSIKQNVVNNVSNFPINEYLTYSSINTVGKNWIQRFALALCKLLLGIIRSKFLSIPYTLNLMSLDGLSLRSLGVNEQDKLILLLKTLLLLSSMYRLVLKKKLIALNLQIINSKVPTKIYIG